MSASRVVATLALLALSTLPASASYDQDFVDAFAAACVPERMSYEGTQKTALATGWTEVNADADPELAATMAISAAAEAAAAAEQPDAQMQADMRFYSKLIEGQAHYLVVSRSQFLVEGDPWAYIGCYLYNFAAAAPIDPAPVTALIGKPVAHSQVDMHIAGWVWGPPCPMPRTADTYLTFVPEVSQYKAETGFSGLVLKFSTSEPEPDEVVPDTYC